MTDICNIVHVGHEGITLTDERFVVVERIKKKARIKFLDEFEAEVVRQYTAVKYGKVRNPYEVVVHGAGRHGRVDDYTDKEKDFWKRNICKKYAQGKLPHLNKCWLVLEFWLEDVRQLKDYDLFVSRKNITIADPFARYDRLEHLRVCEHDVKTRGVVVVDLFNNEYEVYSSRFECAYETGWHEDSVFDFCHAQAERDGYKFYWASDYADLFFE